MNRKNFIQSLALGSAGALVGTKAVAETEARIPGSGAPRDLAQASWSEIRSLFPLRRDRIYLNTGGLGPASQPALDAVFEQSRQQAYTGEHHHAELQSVHDDLARYFGVDRSEVALVRNATEANSLIGSGLALKAGDEVVFESHAHPGGSFTWLNQQKRDGVKVRIFEPSAASAEENLERLFDQVNERTRVIQVSHITATTGLIFDIPAIAAEARRRGIWFHVDGAQSAGMIPVDLKRLGCDSFATSGHKWMNAPIETGVLYIAAERNDEVACSHIGAYSNDEYELPDLLTYVDSAQRHQYGTRNAASALGLQAAIRLQESIGRQRIAEHGAKLARLAREGIGGLKGMEILTPEDPSMSNSILTFRVAGADCAKVYASLSNGYKLRCRVVTERGLNGVRASWHVYHQEEDVARFVEGVRATIAAL